MAQTIKQKCDAIGISLPTYYLRLKNGMTPEEALSTPNKRRASKLKPTPKPAPAPISEPEDQEPRAPLMVGWQFTENCFEITSDFFHSCGQTKPRNNPGLCFN